MVEGLPLSKECCEQAKSIFREKIWRKGVQRLRAPAGVSGFGGAAGVPHLFRRFLFSPPPSPEDTWDASPLVAREGFSVEGAGCTFTCTKTRNGLPSLH